MRSYLPLRGRRTSRAMSVVFSILRASCDNRQPTTERGFNLGDTIVQCQTCFSLVPSVPGFLTRLHDSRLRSMIPRVSEISRLQSFVSVKSREAKSLESSLGHSFFEFYRGSEGLLLIYCI